MGVLFAIIAGIILLVVLGGLVVGLAFKLLWWAIIGLVIGALARLIVPGHQRIGLLGTAGGGIGGSLLGGVIARVAHLGTGLQFLVAIGVAAVLVGSFGAGQRIQAPRRPRARLGR